MEPQHYLYKTDGLVKRVRCEPELMQRAFETGIISKYLLCSSEEDAIKKFKEIGEIRDETV